MHNANLWNNWLHPDFGVLHSCDPARWVASVVTWHCTNLYWWDRSMSFGRFRRPINCCCHLAVSTMMTSESSPSLVQLFAWCYHHPTVCPEHCMLSSTYRYANYVVPSVFRTLNKNVRVYAWYILYVFCTWGLPIWPRNRLNKSQSQSPWNGKIVNKW